MSPTSRPKASALRPLALLAALAGGCASPRWGSGSVSAPAVAGPVASGPRVVAVGPGFDDPVRLTDGLPDGPPAPDAPPPPARLTANPAFPDDVRISRADDGPTGRPGPGEGDGGDDDEGGGPGMRPEQEDTNLDRSRAGRQGGGGGPTREEERNDDSNYEDEFKSDLLDNLLGLQDSDIGVFGWVQGSFTGNQYHPRNGMNFGVTPNAYANRWLFQQLYFVVEKRLDPNESDEYGFGFRVDSLSGSDWKQYHMVGFLDGSITSNTFGYEPVQFYGEVHLPWLTDGGVDVKGGRFFSLPGYESVAAPARPLNSTTYLFGFGQPYTNFGVMTTWHVTDRLNVYNGAVNGSGRWIDRNYRWGYSGAVVWDAPDDRTNATFTLNVGPNQFPYFFKAGYPFAPNGVPQPPYMAGGRNPIYDKNDAVLMTTTLIHAATDRLTLIAEGDYGYEWNIPGLGPGGTTTNGNWYGAAGFLLYDFHEQLTGVYRAEVFRDVNGTRTGFNNTYYETSLGLIYKPRPWLRLRPEVRWDWTGGAPVYDDATSRHQFTYGFDAIFLF